MIDANRVTTAFDAYIKKIYETKPEQRDFLLKHERRHLAEKECQHQIRMCAFNMGARFNQHYCLLLLESAVNLFCQLALEAKRVNMLSEAAKQAEIQKAGELQDTQNMLDDMAKEAMSTAIKKAGVDVPSGNKTENLGGNRSVPSEILLD